MDDIAALTKAAQEARAILDSARGKTAIAVAEAACAEACRALAAAKRQAGQPPTTTLDVAAYKSAQAAREERAALGRSVKRAGGLYMVAQEYPRCGQRWPMTAAEREADSLLREHGAEFLGEGWQE